MVKIRKRDPLIYQAEQLLYLSKGIPIRIKSLEARLNGGTEVEGVVPDSTTKRIEQLQWIDATIHSFMISLNDEDRMLVNLHWINKKPWDDVCQELSITKNVFYKHKSRILFMLIDHFIV